MTNDKDLKRDVEQELFWEPSVNAERIGITANGGVIKLDGHTGRYAGHWPEE